ncbi:putative nuclease HARBI1 [Heterodontus francisci]|uniref:putative nuclease HARBI1 n=1 Tax=Heterodontus francisci TaxID=7792 RepID=UPI00355C1B6E
MMQDELYARALGGNPISVMLKVILALNLYTSGSFQRSTGDMCSISQSVAHQCIKEVTNAIFRRASDYVWLRMDPNSQAEKTNGIGAIAGFPQVQSVTDCMHVAIKAHEHQLVNFIDRKGFHSDNVQLGSNHYKQILCMLPGKLLRCLHFEAVQGARAFAAKGYLLGTQLLKPVRNPRKDAEERHNACHGTKQTAIEQAIDLLKMGFRCLDRSSGAFQYAPARVSCIVVVCCALHNLTVQRGETISNDEAAEGMMGKPRQMKDPRNNRRVAMRYVQGRLTMPLYIRVFFDHYCQFYHHQ